MSGIISSMNISASALMTQKTKMDIISQNIANAETIQTTDAEPYRRRVVTLEARNDEWTFEDYLTARIDGNKPIATGVEIHTVEADDAPFKLVFDPDNPYADEKGYVQMSNVDTTEEILDLMTTTRAYEANLTALNTTKSMLLKALEIGN
jgi:flagellar basal-body rod protein FlgC